MNALEIFSKVKKYIELYQKCDNIELQKELITLGEKIQEMQDTIETLKQENSELKRIQELSPKLIAHESTYLTKEGQSDSIKYCTTCWESKKKLIQLNCENGAFSCNECNNHGFYDHEQYTRSMEDIDLVY